MFKVKGFTDENFQTFICEFYTMKKNGLRLGQALCNAFIEGSNPDLFYEKDDKRAMEIFMDIVNQKG